MTSLYLAVHTSESFRQVWNKSALKLVPTELTAVISTSAAKFLGEDETMPVPERRYLKRSPCKQRASLVLDLKRQPCLVVDSSKNGFRVRGSFRLKRGQLVEIVLDEDPFNPVRCSVAWVGKAGSRQEGEVGLETV